MYQSLLYVLNLLQKPTLNDDQNFLQEQYIILRMQYYMVDELMCELHVPSEKLIRRQNLFVPNRSFDDLMQIEAFFVCDGLVIIPYVLQQTKRDHFHSNVFEMYQNLHLCSIAHIFL
jgi:hypothetical protein